MSNAKTIAEWEKLNGCIVIDFNGNEKLTEEEFNNIPFGKKAGVNHKDRINFLERNGYEVTRENLIDSSLSAKPKD